MQKKCIFVPCFLSSFVLYGLIINMLLIKQPNN